jgi:hypothetical protein
MKYIFTITILIACLAGFNQQIIEWTPEYNLSLTDFQSPQTEINQELTSYTIISGANVNFSFHMSSYEFILTKNFNSKVKSTFNRSAAVIVAPDTITAMQLVSVGQFNFDLSELYARKFRKQLYEQKGAFSNVSFFQPIFDNLQVEMKSETARVLKATDLGKDEKLLNGENEKVLQEIETLSDFCFDCKPVKKKGKKRKKN